MLKRDFVLMIDRWFSAASGNCARISSSKAVKTPRCPCWSIALKTTVTKPPATERIKFTGPTGSSGSLSLSNSGSGSTLHGKPEVPGSSGTEASRTDDPPAGYEELPSAGFGEMPTTDPRSTLAAVSTGVTDRTDPSTNSDGT